MGDGTEFTSEEIENKEEPNPEEQYHITVNAGSYLSRLIREKGMGKGVSKEECEEVAKQVDRLTGREIREKEIKESLIKQLNKRDE